MLVYTGSNWSVAYLFIRWAIYNNNYNNNYHYNYWE